VGIDYYLANAPLQKNLYSDDIGAVAAALCSPAFGAMTGETIYVDNGDLT
jgi:enoyl-[acyl-carrier protein] reductase I